MLFLQKNAKFSNAGGFSPDLQPPAAGGFAPRPLLASGSWGLRPQTPILAPPLRVSGYEPGCKCLNVSHAG